MMPLLILMFLMAGISVSINYFLFLIPFVQETIIFGLQYLRLPLREPVFRLSIDSGLAAKDLFTIPSPLSRSLEPCCDSDNVLSCVDVEVDPEVLLNEDDISINNVTLLFSNFIPPHARTYKTEAGDEAVISYNARTGSITGTLHTADGHAFALERCGGSYIFEEFDVASFPEEEEGDDSDYVEAAASHGANTTAASRQGQRTYSVMFYYTAEFAAATPNIEDYFDQVE